MFARVTTVYLPEESTSIDILKVHERLYAGLRKLNGFHDYIALVNRSTGEAKAIILWASKEEMQQHKAATTELLSLIGAELFTSPQHIEEYDVAFHT